MSKQSVCNKNQSLLYFKTVLIFLFKSHNCEFKFEEFDYKKHACLHYRTKLINESLV